MLDKRRFHDWLRLFTDDVQHWMTALANRYHRSSKAITILNPQRYAEEDMTRQDELGLFDEDLKSPTARIARLDTSMAWAEDSPCRTRHLIANIEVVPDASVPEVTVGAAGPPFYCGNNLYIFPSNCTRRIPFIAW